MNALTNKDDISPSVAVRLLIDQHGLLTVLRALAAQLLRPRPGPRREDVRLDHLSPHMRRDMGLLPIELPRKYWELR